MQPLIDSARNWPLARKILIINGAVALITWSVAIGLILLDQLAIERRALAHEGRLLAELVARDVGAAPRSSRGNRMQEVVAQLRARPKVAAVAVYGASGDLVMGTADTMAIPTQYVADDGMDGGLMRVQGIIGKDSHPDGHVLVWMDGGALWSRILGESHALIVMAAVAAVCVVLLVWLALPVTLRRLARLNQTVRAVTQQGNYALRAQIKGRDEIGELAEAFNGMLDQIQARDAAVREELAERQRAQKQTAYLASHDSATGLPNRRFFLESLLHALSERADKRCEVAVLLVDVDNFKRVNDSLGHRAGDQLLTEVGSRLRTQIGSAGLVCRVGGDEFAVVLEAVRDEQQAQELGAEALRALGRPAWIEGTELSLGASIGIAVSRGECDADMLMRNADTAMHQAKDSGKGLVRVYRAYMNDRVQHRLTLEQDLRKALEQDQLSLHYQPQVDTHSGRIVGVEALMRWQHPRLGSISPAHFIPIAEDSGLVVPLGAWALRRACSDAQRWQSQGLDGVCVSVNVSARQFAEPNFVATVLGALFQASLPGHLLELELTESLLFDQHGTGLRSLNALRERGISLAIDDFGTGYSSLAYLKKFPIQRLKIDRGFIKNIPDAVDDMAIAGAMIALGHKLGLQIVAEGVENRAQYNFLIDQACDFIQGYLFARPMTLEDLLDQWAAREDHGALESLPQRLTA